MRTLSEKEERASEMDFETRLAGKAEETLSIIEKYFPEGGGRQDRLIQAMNYSLKSGGKRLRPMIMREFYTAFGGRGEVVEPFMAAIEMIHTFSLIHDDLPAMDNDELRRGKPTNHMVYGEAMAILAGDGLLNLSMETALKAFELEAENRNIPKALKILYQNSGLNGMTGGQALDVQSEKENLRLDIDDILFIHTLKTAALLSAAAQIGAVLAGCSEEELEKIREAMTCIGIAFQIQDDILDVEGDEKLLGKSIGSDEKQNKTTYVTLKGLEESRRKVAELTGSAIGIMDSLNDGLEFMKALSLKLSGRKS